MKPVAFDEVALMSSVAAWTAIAVGGTVLLGWMCSIPALTRFLPGPRSVSLGSAMAFAGAGIAMVLHGSTSSKRFRTASIAMIGILISMWGLTTFFQEGFSAAIKRAGLWLGQPESWQQMIPDPTSPIMACAFISLGLAVLCLTPSPLSNHGIPQYLGLLTMLLGGVATIGHLYGVRALYKIELHAPITLQASGLFVVLGIGILMRHPNQGFMQTLFSHEIGGALLRRLLPFAIGLPILAGWLRILGERYGWYSFTFGVAVSVAVVLFLLLSCLWYVAEYANRVDRQRHQALHALADRDDRLRMASSSARIGYWSWYPLDDRIELDHTALVLIGLSPSQRVNIDTFLSAFDRPAQETLSALFHQARNMITPFECECSPVSPTASAQWVSVRADRGRNLRESIRPIVGVMIDITARKAVELELRTLASTIQTSQDFVGICDENLHPTFINRAGLRLVGLRDMGQARERSVHDFFLPEDQAEIADQVLPEVLERGFTSKQVRFRHFETGQPIWMKCNVVRLTDATGRTNGFATIGQDITKQREDEAALRESEARFRQLADITPVMIRMADASGSTSYLNRQWTVFSGETDSAGLNDAWQQALHPADQDSVVRSFGAGQLRCEQQIEYRLRRKDGEYRWVLDSTSPRFKGDSTEVIGYISSIFDITERKEAEQALRQFATELEGQVNERTRVLLQTQERLRGLTTALTRTAHQERRRIATELHDYLAQLLVVSRLHLAQVANSTDRQQRLDLLKQAEQRLDEALTYTRSLVAELSPQVLYHLGLPAALRWLGEQMSQYRLNVKTDAVCQSSLILPDETATLLYYAVRELLFNIVKHADTVHAEVSLQQSPDGELTISVSDQGRGFDPLHLEQTNNTGTHFGLFNIRERVQGIGGAVSLTSSPGKGTCVTLMYRPTHTELPMPSSTSMVSRQGAVAVIDRPAATRYRVLLADDHAMVRGGLRALINRYSELIVVGEADDGAHAVELTAMLSPDVVVMDINMPHMDGIEATHEIKRAYPHIIVIGLSVQTMAQVAQRMLAAGASACLNKESAADQLYKTILAFVEPSRHSNPAEPRSQQLTDRTTSSKGRHVRI